MRRYKKRLIPVHQEFLNKYVCNRNHPSRMYKIAYFCEDEDIAIVLRREDYLAGYKDRWGCVTMANQLLIPFENARIIDFGRFLIAINGIFYLYNKRGDLLFPFGGIRKTPHKAYVLFYDRERMYFRITIRKIDIIMFKCKRFFVMENGLAFLQLSNDYVGLMLFSKQKLPFYYSAIAVPQNGYSLGIIESGKDNGKVLYDCQLIKIKSQIKKDNSIHPTGINLFVKKTINEVNAYFEDKEQFEKDCNSIICYNEQVRFSAQSLCFFPNDTPNVGDEAFCSEEMEMKEEYYNEWENRSYKDVLYDAFGGEMDAIWNID